ncbi:MAG TPA: hypothetical protein VHS52_09440 [Acidimicrobiales bacterium]|nr:hypothetical protein [Acidimicrobiales bacterium]
MAGVALAAAVLGPALGPRPVFALDATFVARIPVPTGIWGLGPELPRRVPLGLGLAWVSTIVGAAAGPLLLALALVIAFVGATRLVADSPWAVRVGAGLLFAASPLMLTRVGAGQWTAVAPFAVLPWALPSLLAPGEAPARTFLWAAALGATGSVGGTLALVVAAVGVVGERRRASLLAAALVGLAQLPWVLPALVVQSANASPAGSDVFATRAHGVVGALGLLAGHGFWRAPSQVGGDTSPGVALLGLGLLGLALVGASSLPPRWRWRAAGLAGAGMALALASAVPGVRDAYQSFSRTGVGAPLRESQRFAVLTLVWLAPASASGAARLAEERGRLPAWTTLALPAAAAIVLGGPGLWGVGGRLEPSSLPADWGRARRVVEREPGAVLALPYVRYLDLPAAGGRRVLNPVPDYFGGDVLSSSDPQAGPSSQSGYRERADPRELPVLIALTAALAPGAPGQGARPLLSDTLVRAGVRWVVLLHAADWTAYRGLATDPGLVPVVQGASLDLLQVGGWKASVVDDAGDGVGRRPLVAPLERLDASPAAVWAQPAEPGWMRGIHGAGRTASGLVRLPAGGGLLWFWPAAVVLAGDALIVACLAFAWWGPSPARKGTRTDTMPPWWRRRRTLPRGPDDDGTTTSVTGPERDEH